MSKNTLAILLIVGPFILLIASLTLYAILSFLLSAVGGSGAVAVIASVINVILGFLGIIAMVGLIPCFIAGIVILVKKK